MCCAPFHYFLSVCCKCSHTRPFGHRVSTFFLTYLPNPGFMEHHFCIFPLIFPTSTCTQLNFGWFFFKYARQDPWEVCFTSLGWNPSLSWNLMLHLCQTHMLIEFGTQIKKLNPKENSSLLLNGSIGPFHSPAVPPFLQSPLIWVMFLSSLCFMLPIIGFCLVSSYHANALDRPGLLFCTVLLTNLYAN